MKKFHYFLVFLAFVGVFLSGYFLNQRMSVRNESATSGRRILYYVDPMNPSHTSDKPGLAPCGMKLEPIYADQGSGEQGLGKFGASLPPGTVKISSEKQQIIGVQTGKVEMVSESHMLRALGRVAADENRIYRVLAPTEGYMGDIRTAVPTGSIVQKDQLLTSYYSTESLGAQQAYLFALSTLDRRPNDQSHGDQTGQIYAQVRKAEENLRVRGIGEAQIKEIARTRQVSNLIEQRAPIAGLVVSRNIFPFSRFEKDAEFFRIVDLSRVWVLADVYENEEKYIKPGTVARVSLPGRDRVFHANLSDALPQFDSNSRTYKVRLDAANPDWILRPDAFVDVEFSLKLPPALAIPREAVLDSGLKKIVYVDRGQGYFEPRKVKTGWSFGDRVEILGGLMPDERIVISGNFLIDSESRMKLAASSMQGPTAMDLVCGMEVSEKTAAATGNISELNGTTYYFCSHECKREFDGNSNRFVENREKEVSHSGHGPPAVSSLNSDDHKAGEHTVQNMPQVRKLHHHAAENTAQADSPSESAAHKARQISMSPEHPSVPETLQFDPVCGEKVDPKKAEADGNTSMHGGVTYYFVSRLCKQVFDMHSEHFLEKLREGTSRPADQSSAVTSTESHDRLVHPETDEHEFSVDPVCGDKVEWKKAQAAGKTSVHDGATYYFCSESCKQEFDKRSRQTVEQLGGGTLHQNPVVAPALPVESQQVRHQEAEQKVLDIDPHCEGR